MSYYTGCTHSNWALHIYHEMRSSQDLTSTLEYLGFSNTSPYNSPTKEAIFVSSLFIKDHHHPQVACALIPHKLYVRFTYYEHPL